MQFLLALLALGLLERARLLHSPVPVASALTRRSVCAGLALVGTEAVAPLEPCLAKSSRTQLLNQLAHLVLVRRRIGRIEAVLAPTLGAVIMPGTSSPRVVVATQSKALFKELEFERNMEGAMAFLADVPQARTLGRDSLEFLASTVSFDGFASFDDPINEGMLARETTPAKLEYVRRAVAKVRAPVRVPRALRSDASPRARRFTCGCFVALIATAPGCIRARAVRERSLRARSTRSSACLTPRSSSRRASSQMIRASPEWLERLATPLRHKRSLVRFCAAPSGFESRGI